MKKNLLTSFLIFLLIHAACPAQDFIRYTHAKNGYSLMLPAKWQLVEAFLNKTDFSVLSPVEPSDKVRENANMVTYELPKTTHDEFYQLAKNSLAGTSEQWKLIEEGETTSHSGIRILYLINEHPSSTNGRIMKNIVFFYHLPGKGFILTCTAIPDTFDRFKPTFEDIALSLEWLQ